MRPTIFVTVVNDQASAFGCIFESSVVVGVPSAAVLHSLLIVKVMHHFMQQCGSNLLNGSCQCSCADVDFMGCAKLGNPCVLTQGEVALGLGCGLNGDGRP